MKITLTEITIREIAEGYVDDHIDGVVGYGGKLNIRPKYQREFVYKDRQRDAVMETVVKNFPLNVMYWVINEDGTYEVLDGQQRTISICEYVTGIFSIDSRYMHNLTEVEKAQILDYKLTVYFCEGNDKEKLDWFKTINIAGEKLSEQELRNAIYTGPWLSDAKRYFSKPHCTAYHIGSDYLSGSAIRQDYLETLIDWISNGKIEDYMAKNQHQANANELWLYFNAVINWIRVVFKEYRKEMKGIAFGPLYNSFKNKAFDADLLEEEIARLMEDEDVTKKSGIYEYVLTKKERCLSLRTFTDKQKREAYQRQKGICKKCKKHFHYPDMEADHIKPWSKGGKTISENCQMLCKQDNRLKSGV